jgi:hypothetical protein
MVLWAPAAWLAIFAALVVRACLEVGVWPVGRSGNPLVSTYVETTIDPAVFEVHTAATWLGPFGFQVVVPLALLLLVASAFVRDLRPRPSAVAGFGAGVLAIALLLSVDPGGYFDWFLD